MIKRNKKGVSVIIGYVLLIVFVIAMGVVIYNWMKTYVPKEDLVCPDEVSLFIKDYSCDSNELNLTLKNNGMFSVGGYFIRVTDNPQAGLATVDISPNITSGGEFLPPSGVKFTGSKNSLAPSYDESHLFDISHLSGLYKIEIIPLRWQEQDKRERIATCRTSIVREDLICS
jgi:hypothetical protein